jgi:hypothetical protein
LLNPPGCVGAELASFCGIKTFHSLHQADISFGNEVQQRKSQIRVIVGDLNNQSQIRLDHQSSRFSVSFFDTGSELDFFLGSEQRDLPDFPKVNLNASI